MAEKFIKAHKSTGKIMMGLINLPKTSLYVTINILQAGTGESHEVNQLRQVRSKL